jgi:hypothetical protein
VIWRILFSFCVVIEYLRKEFVFATRTQKHNGLENVAGELDDISFYFRHILDPDCLLLRFDASRTCAQDNDGIN